MARHSLSSSQGQDGWTLTPFFPGFMAHKFQHILPHQFTALGALLRPTRSRSGCSGPQHFPAPAGEISPTDQRSRWLGGRREAVRLWQKP